MLNIEEYHMLSSAGKVEASEIAQDNLQDARTACGGLGFSWYSIFGDQITFNDVGRTYEGDNYILCQQTAKLLLKNLKYLLDGKSTHWTCKFLKLDPVDEMTSFSGKLDQPEDLLILLEYWVKYYM
mgnify:FL=1